MRRVISNEVCVLNCYSGSWMENKLIRGSVCAFGWQQGMGVLLPVSWPPVRWRLPYPSPLHSPDNQSLCRADHLRCGPHRRLQKLQGPSTKTWMLKPELWALSNTKWGCPERYPEANTPHQVQKPQWGRDKGGFPEEVMGLRLRGSQVFFGKGKTHPFCRENLYYSSQESRDKHRQTWAHN